VPVTHEIAGSNPVASAISSSEMATTHAAVAQSVEQRTENPRVASSILACGTINERK
jgi:hypothetical protein